MCCQMISLFSPQKSFLSSQGGDLAQLARNNKEQSFIY